MPLPFVPGSWTMVVIPDTQNYNASYPAIFSDITTWIKDNKDVYNIGLTLQEGDITDDNNSTQWQNAKNAISILDGEVPYILSPGNADYGSNATDRSTYFNNYFDESIYYDGGQVFPDLAIVEQFEDVSRFGSGPDNKTLENVAYDFTAPDGRKMLVFSLEWGVRQEVIDWANTVAIADDDALQQFVAIAEIAGAGTVSGDFTLTSTQAARRA